MTDVGLHGAHVELVRAASRKDSTNGTRLDRVTGSGTSTVGLEVLSVIGVQAVTLVGVTNELLLSNRVGQGNTVLLAVVVGAGSADESADLVVVGESVALALEDSASDTLTTDVTAARLIESGAATVGGQHSQIGHSHVDIAVVVQRRTDDDGDVGLSVQERLVSQVEADQRRRAGSVNGYAGAVKVVKVRNTVAKNCITSSSDLILVLVRGSLRVDDRAKRTVYLG